MQPIIITQASSENSWRDTYTHLKRFVGATPNIKISDSVVLIPDEVKAEFYRLFDAARIAFVKEHCLPATQDGYELSHQYKTLCAEVLQETGLGPVEVASDLKWFLQDPVDGLQRFLFKPLFKLLANQVDSAEFERLASKQINDAYAALFREGYQRWIAVGIVRRLLPEASYRVPAMDGIYDVLMGEGHENPGLHKDEVPEAQETKGLSFEQHPIISFITPRIIVRSRRTSTFVSLHTDFKEAEWTASRRSSNMEWHEIAALKTEYNLQKLRPDLIKKAWYELEPILPDFTFYTASEVDDLALIADFKYMLRPEMSVAIMESPDWSEGISPEVLKRRLCALRPRQGALVICRQEVSTATIEAFSEENLRIISVGYDEQALDAVVSLLSPSA